MAMLLLAACASARSRPGARDDLLASVSTARDGASEVRAGWRALVDGRDAEARALFTSALRDHPGDGYARFGRAALAFEQADVRTALYDDLALLEHAASPRTASAAERSANANANGDADGPMQMQTMAAGRLAILLDEFSGAMAEKDDIERRILALSGSAASGTWVAGWRTRYELAMLADGVARRRADPALIARTAEQSGCVRHFRVLRPAGLLPHLDLDAPEPRGPSGVALSARAGESGEPRQRPVESLGCRVSLPSFEDRAGAQRAEAELSIVGSGPGGGPAQAFDLVLDSSSEARLTVDGGPPYKHGDGSRFGPRVSAAHVSLAPGRHRVELRLATYGGRPELSLLLVPSSSAPSPSPSPTAGGAASSEPPAGLPPELTAAVELAGLYVANRHGDAEVAWHLAALLDRYPRFSLGRALQGTTRREDPSVPPNVARDRARARWGDALTLDPELARVRHSLAALDLDEERPRPAIEAAKAAARSAPDWWLPPLTLYGAYRLRGLDLDADQALARAIQLGGEVCTVREAARSRAEDRRDVAGEARWSAALAGCPGGLDDALERLRRRGDLPGALALLQRMIRLAPERDALKVDLAATLLAAGKPRQAADVLGAVVEPIDAEGQLRRVDALMVAGQPARARDVLAALATRRPDLPEVMRAARMLSIPLPLEPFRLDGRQIIHAFEASGRRYRAPAVVVLDRTVTRIFADGTEMTLTHEIVRVQSKDAIEKWGEISVPDHAEVLAVRTHKADGTTREPEEVVGKESISAADLAIGDYVEKEILELHAPDEAFARAGGFIGDRFFFQSFDAPLDRTEYLVVTDPTPAGRISVDARAGAPESVVSRAADGCVVTTFARQRVAQKFGESASVPVIEIVPSVRVVRAASWVDWTRFLREQTYGTEKASWGLRDAAAEIRHQAGSGEPEALAAALVAWVGKRIEDDEDLRDSATFSIARGRGNRVAVILALARMLGLSAEPVLARSRLTADAAEPAPVAELDDFGETLIEFARPVSAPPSPWSSPSPSPSPSPSLSPASRSPPAAAAARATGPISASFFDPRLKHAPVGYLPPGLEGAPIVHLGAGAEPGGQFAVARGRSDDDGRSVDLTASLDEKGGARARVVEEVRGWPALEWAEVIDKLGNDRDKIRQDFEQRWLGVQFPGAVLQDLNVDVYGEGGRLISHLTFPWSPATPGPEGSVAPTGASRKVGPAPPPPGAGGAAAALAGPYSVARIRLVYSFASARLAIVRGRELRFQPTFFRTLPGRRYATEATRETVLATGFDVPLDLRAEIDLPAGAKVDADASRTTQIDRAGAYRFVERRALGSRGDGRQVIQLQREARLPIVRVAPLEYPRVAEELRAVDSAEQEEIRITLAAGGSEVTR